MDQKMTLRGARTVTATFDDMSDLVQERFATLGLPQRIALDWAKRTDIIADVIEKQALANFPRQADGEVLENSPAAKNDPEVPMPTAESAGPTDESPTSDDQNKPETYYEGAKSKVADDDEDDDDGKTASDDELLRTMLAEEGMGKAATPEWSQPARNETGESTEPAPFAGGTPHWDANAIGDDRGGPYKQEPDEAYMTGEFSQDWFHELRDKQQAGGLPGVDKFAALDGILASEGNLSVENLNKLGAAFNQIVADSANLSRLPGLSPMQLRAQVNRIAEIRQELEVMNAQLEGVVKKVRDLDKEEKKGLKALKDAASAMNEKGKYLAETEKAMLQFTAYLSDKVPGIAQMIAREGEAKVGDRAGDMFGRVSAELGEDVAAAVERIYMATKDDLTYAKMCIRGIKVVVKTSSVDDATLKTAGVVDMAVSMREWLSGKVDSLASRILGFTGDIAKWVKGFLIRSKIVKKESNVIKGILSSAEKSIDQAFAASPNIRAASPNLSIAATDDDEDDKGKKAKDDDEDDENGKEASTFDLFAV